jgi:methylase of polypeptide subunit release factors
MGTRVKIDRMRNRTVCDANIDTVFLCKAIASVGMSINDIKAVEFGCGSGFVSKFLLNRFSQISSLIAVDISQESISCAKENIDDKRVQFIHDNADVFFSKNDLFDLIVCNPPYVPTLNDYGNRSYEGTAFFKNLIENGHKILSKNGKIIINLSSVAQPFVEEIIKKSKMKIEKVAQMSVPFKILTTLNDDSKMNYLLSNGLLTSQQSQGYEYWHDIYVLVCEHPNKPKGG